MEAVLCSKKRTDDYLCHDLAKTAKSLSIFLFFFFFFSFYLGLTTQKEVRESVMSQVSHKSQSHDRKSQHHIT